MKYGHSVSILQGNEKKCYLTGAENVPLHKHHIYEGNPRRAISDKHGFWIWLKPELHNASPQGVHFNRELNLHIKRDCQRAYEAAGHSRADFIALIGRSYLI